MVSQKQASGEMFPRISKPKDILKSQTWSNTEFPIIVKSHYLLTIWSLNSFRENPVVNLETAPNQKPAESDSSLKSASAGKLAKQEAEVGTARILRQSWGLLHILYLIFFRLCGRLTCILIWDVGYAFFF